MRNPYTVFESTRSFFTNTIQPLKLEDFSNQEIQDNIVKTYRDLYFKYEKDKNLIPKGNLIEVKFEDFEKNALEMTKNIYESLSIPGFENARPAIEAYYRLSYLDTKKGYKKNQYKYEEETVRIVENNWDFALKDWGYEL